MIDILARYIDGEFVFTPKKRRGMSKGEYLRALAACERLNEDGIQSSSSAAAFLPDHKAPDQVPLSQLPLFEEMNRPEHAPTVIESPPDDDQQPKPQDLSYKPDQ